MKYARIHVLPGTPPGGLTAGIDWGSADHAVCVVDAAGQVRARFTVAHDRAGIGKLIAGLRAAGVREAAIERSDGVLVDALLEAGLTLVVITSRQMKNLRSRYGSAGAKDDRFDAFVLADVLRTDRARLRPLVVDTPATAALRAVVRARRDLVAHRIAACNQLRAHLAAVFPGAVRLFAALDSQISLAFLARFATQDAVDQVSEEELAVWLGTLPRRGNAPRPGQLHARLQAAARGTAGADGAARAAITGALVATLITLAAQIKALEAEIAAQLAAHPDAHIFTSLPRAGTVRAARLLAETGDCRARFPDPGSLAGLAGVAPVTRQSGKHISAGFRWAVNRQLRDAVRDFAADSRHASCRAAAIYDAARARGKDHPHAVRILARAWIYVIWRCWQDGTAYDPARHNALQRVLDQQQAAQAEAAGPDRTGDRRDHRRAARSRGRPVPGEAGTELLTSHGGILHRRDFAAFVHTGTSISDGTTPMAWIGWDAVLSALHHGQLPVCGGERRILQLAASIAEGFPVSLRDTIPGLDNRNLELLTTAIRHAAGHRPLDP